MLLKTPTAKLPEAPRTQRTKTTQPATPVPESAVTIPPLANPMGTSGGFGIPIPPPSIRGIHVAEGEFNSPAAAAIAENVISFSVQSAFVCRYIYSLLVVNPSVVGNYYFLASVKFWKDQSPIGEWPICDAVSPAAASVLPRSLLSFFVGGGNVIDSSAMLFLLNPVAGIENTQYTLQPQYMECEIDRITVSIKEVRNVTGFRIYAACKSIAKLSGY
jgi:hypothetical protein